MSPAAIVRLQFQVGRTSGPKRTQQWPEQHNRANEKRAMEESFEVKPAEETQNAMISERLRRPEKDRRQQRADQDHGDKINHQSKCISQPAYCKVCACC